ncbi:MAG: glycosyltransferase family 4 protein [Bacteroidota bacterium]
MMYILHLSSAKTWRGGEQQIAYLIEELQLLEIQQSVFCVENGAFAAWCQQESVECKTYRKRASFDPKIAKQISKLVREQQITHLHAHDSHAHTYAFLASVLFRLKVPIIVSRRVDFPVSNSLLSRWKYNHSSIKKIICISHHIQRILQPAINDHRKLTVVHSGIRAERFPDAHQNILRKSYQIPQEKKIIANIAALADHKDYPTFVRTAAILLDQRKDIHFFIIGGDAGVESNIHRMIAEKQLEDYITLTGYQKEVASIFPELDLLLFTSKEEGLGTTVLDAFACGVAVVATAAGGIPEMITHRATGSLAPIGRADQLAEEVIFLLEQEEERKRIIKNAKNKLSEFSSKKMADAVLEVYRELYSKH